MQQTETLKLNLIEGTDTVDPAPINENMETLEGETAAIRTEMAALAANVGSVGQNCRIVTGSYVGTGTAGSSKPNSLSFDFKPMLVILCAAGDQACRPGHFLRPVTALCGNPGYTVKITWTDKGLSWYSNDSTALYQYNYADRNYYYIAFGIDE